MIQSCIKSFWRNIFTPIIQLHKKEKKLKKKKKKTEERANSVIFLYCI